MITDSEKWHYINVKSLPALLKGITSKHDEDSYCLNSLHSFSTENKLKRHKTVCKNSDYCCIEMPKRWKHIKMYSWWKEVYKNSIYYLCWHWAFTWETRYMS